MEIGKPRRVHHVEPLRSPVPQRRQRPEPSPKRAEPAKEPAVTRR